MSAELPAMTREELLATVHVLEPGDLLFIRVDRAHIDPKWADQVKRILKEKIPLGVEVLVGANDIQLEQYRLIKPEEEATAP